MCRTKSDLIVWLKITLPKILTTAGSKGGETNTQYRYINFVDGQFLNMK